MGAHHAPVRAARHRSADAPTSSLRIARLAGSGVLTASAALAMTGAGSGAALAHDSDDYSDSSEFSDDVGGGDDGFLCGILGGDECSSDGDDSSRGSDVGSRDDTRSLFDRVSDGDSSSDDDDFDGADADRSSDASGASASVPAARPSAGTTRPASSGAATQNAQLDTPPPPGQVRTIQVPG